jgi:long-chain acyl-CoA synthetase
VKFRRQTRPLNRLRLILDRGLTAANLLDGAYHSHPDSVIFHLDDELPFKMLTGPDITARALLPFVNRVGNALRESGMNRHDKVAIYKTNSPDYFFLAIAIIRAGGIAVPINPDMKSPALRYHLEQTGSTIVLTDQKSFAASIKDPTAISIVRSWIFVDAPPIFPSGCTPGVDLNAALSQVSDEADPVELKSGDTVFIAHTSGTTGQPKGVVVSSGSVIRCVKAHYIDEPLTTRNRTAVAGYFSHLVYNIGFFASAAANFPVYTATRRDPKTLIQLLEHQSINVFFAFPDVYFSLYHHGLDGYALRSMRIWVATAAPSCDVHMRAFCRKGAYVRVLGVPVVRSIFIDTLGSTEISSSALRRVRFPFLPIRLDRPAGRPTPAGPRVRVVGDNGQPVAANVPGWLEVKGPTVFEGYWRDGRIAPDGKRNGWWRTGDVACRDRLGRFHHLDRAVDVVTTNAGRLYTLPIEEFLMSHPQVRHASVIGVPNGEGSHDPVAFVVARSNQELDAQAVRDWANSHFSPSAALRQVLIVEPGELPRGHTGKVLKRVLRERHAALLG